MHGCAEVGRKWLRKAGKSGEQEEKRKEEGNRACGAAREGDPERKHTSTNAEANRREGQVQHHTWHHIPEAHGFISP